MLNKKINLKNLKPNTEFIGKKIVYFKTIDSTNNIAKKTDCTEGTVFIAETQTQGRGRLGRNWTSEKNSGIYMSIVLTPKIPYEHISRITLVTGLAVCDVLTEIYKLPFKIKWPNDIVIEGKKVCGILVEGIIDIDNVKVINGIGINVNNKNFIDDLKNKATSLYILTKKKNDRTKILNRFFEVFEKYYNEFLNNGITNILNKYTELCVTLNREVTIVENNKETNATAEGITPDGELIIKKQDGTTQSINSGEVSVKGIYNN